MSVARSRDLNSSSKYGSPFTESKLSSPPNIPCSPPYFSSSLTLTFLSAGGSSFFGLSAGFCASFGFSSLVFSAGAASSFFAGSGGLAASLGASSFFASAGFASAGGLASSAGLGGAGASLAFSAGSSSENELDSDVMKLL